MKSDNKEFKTLLIGILIGCSVSVFLLPDSSGATGQGETAVQSMRVATLGGADEYAHESRSSSRSTGAHQHGQSSNRVAIAQQAGETPRYEETLEILPARMPTERELLKRYGSMSLPELVGAEKSLNYVVNTEARAFLEKKIELGQFTTQVLANGTPLDVTGQFPDGAPRSTITKYYPLGGGLQEVWLAEIHPSEQPILAARHAEIAWVSLRVQALSREVAED